MSKYSEITTIEELMNLEEMEKREELENIEEIEDSKNIEVIETSEEMEKYYKKNIRIFKITMYNNYIFYTVTDLDGTILFYVFDGKSFYNLDLLIQEIEALINRDKGDSR